MNHEERFGNIFIQLYATCNRTQVERLNVFAIKPYVKDILIISKVHNCQN